MKALAVAILLFIICSSSELSFSQSQPGRNERAAAKAYQLASGHLQRKDYALAITALRETVQHSPGFIKAHQQLGDCLRLTGDYEEARESYKKVLQLDPHYSALTIFGLAISDFYCGLYDSALSGFRKYRETPSLSPSSRALVEKHINDCLFSIQAIKSPHPFAPVNLGPGINSAAHEYFPVVTADDKRLVYTRRKDGNEDLYESNGVPGAWPAAEELGRVINTSNFNEGAQSITPDGKYLFFSGCGKPGGQGRCDIYISHRIASGWSEPFNPGQPLNTGAWESQPSISADGHRLYFVSDRKGGYGGNDIWYADLLTDGTWSEPRNAGPNINTGYDEHSPFIYPDKQTLYFSSNGWPGFGRQDLFVSRCDESGVWQKPENLGSPVNTAREQSGLMISTDGITAYYASDRPEGLGEMDIYSFSLAAAHRPQPVMVIQRELKDVATDEKAEARIWIEDARAGHILFEQNPEEGSDLLAVVPSKDEYILRVLKEGYMPYAENIKSKDVISPVHLKKTVGLKRIQAMEQGVLNNIFFETDQFSLLPESRTELNFMVQFLNLNPSIRIEIGGHTDSMGTEEWNLSLSENRAKEVYKFLLANKISQSRLSYKGYGRSKPIRHNTTESGRQMNRRTSFTILP